MRKEFLEAVPETVERIQQFWLGLRAGPTGLPTLGGGRGTLLVTPLGNRSAVLYSALSRAAPDRCLVICSSQSQTDIDQAVERARYAGPLLQLAVHDPHGGFAELDRIRTEAGPWRLEADRILANLTGGTTLMGLFVQQLVETGARRSRPYRRFALIDRRPPAQQDAQPWQASDLHWLDAV